MAHPKHITDFLLTALIKRFTVRCHQLHVYERCEYCFSDANAAFLIDGSNFRTTGMNIVEGSTQLTNWVMYEYMSPLPNLTSDIMNHLEDWVSCVEEYEGARVLITNSKSCPAAHRSVSGELEAVDESASNFA